MKVLPARLAGGACHFAPRTLFAATKNEEENPMRAYAVKLFCEPIAEITVPDPHPKGTEVVIEVTRCGVCHSDLHLQEGYYDLGGGKKLSLADRGVT
ncbi:hypothetical protein ACGE32_34215, partial [Klebsiella pneumoniae]